MNKLQHYVSQFIVDIKDMNPDIYEKYTGVKNTRMRENLQALSEHADKVTLRIPHIPNFNCVNDVQNSIKILRSMGFSSFNEFEYTVKE